MSLECVVHRSWPPAAWSEQQLLAAAPRVRHLRFSLLCGVPGRWSCFRREARHAELAPSPVGGLKDGTANSCEVQLAELAHKVRALHCGHLSGVKAELMFASLRGRTRGDNVVAL